MSKFCTDIFAPLLTYILRKCSVDTKAFTMALNCAITSAFGRGDKKVLKNIASCFAKSHFTLGGIQKVC